MQHALTCRDLSAGFGRKTVLYGASIDLPAGTVTAIIGPNGSGKSSLLKVLAGALPYTAGEIALDGRSYRAMPPIERARHVAFVPQTFAQTLPLTVEEALAIARYPHHSKVEEAVTNAALGALGIANLRPRHCDTLSGGELRKVLVAQGLAQVHGSDPAVLLLDEPAAFLDPPAQVGIAQLVQLLARRDGMAVAMVLHDLDLARRADNVVLLRAGRVFASGPPTEVMTQQALAQLYKDGDAAEEAAA
ncbi:MAG: ABC transporter ATP-binding protein [bacterium]|nr:ABC transporter ATP-binding protein [bacterium]